MVKIAAIGVGVLVVGVGGLLAMKVMSKPKEVKPVMEISETTPTTTTTPEASTPVVDASPTTSQTNTAPATPAATPVPEPPPAPPVATNEAVTPQVKQEVLARIDKIPNLPAEKKDRLYNSVQRAREMRKIVEINFGSGQSVMPASATAQVKKLLDDPSVMKFRDDLTAVFVVLGFADIAGDEKKSLDISDKRAKSVVDFMEKQAGIKNVTHSVAMGGTTLLDKNNKAKNRIAEIWAVLP